MDSNKISDNRRIAKNTLMLYIRMFIQMAVSLYTARITFQVLGIVDYGVQNIVGGLIVLFSFLNTNLNATTQRFLNFELGHKNIERVSQVFSASLKVYSYLIFVIVFLAETLGLWLLNSILDIPQDRMYAANWVYQLSLLMFCVNIVRTPYNATIMAYEKMSFYAYTSILETLLKLLVVYLLVILSFDKLILLSFMNFIVTILILLIYFYYCRRKYAITKYKKINDPRIFKELLFFSGWTLTGSIANIASRQGINIIVNVFFGVTVNAAIGIGNTIATTVNQFISNFQIAFRPQITKLYAAGDFEKFNLLIFRSSKLSYYLFLVIAIPVIIYCPFMIKLWLGDMPEYSDIFCKLIIVCLMVDAISTPLWMSIEASGKIKVYQLYVSLLIFLNVPLSYLVLKLGGEAYYVWDVKLVINLFLIVFRLVYVKKHLKFPSFLYVKRILIPAFFVSFFSYLPIYFISEKYEVSWVSFISISIISVILTSSLIIILGLDKSERIYLKSFIQKFINK